VKRLFALLAVPALLATLLAPALAAPTQGGYASDNVEYVGFVPFENATSTGITIQGKYMYLTSWKNISTYDISDPTAPQLLDLEPLGFKFENEQVSVSPDGSFLLFSEELPQNILHVYDVEDKTNITKIAEVPGAGDHTTTCINKCKWSYGSDGSITNLADPATPKLMEQNWHELTKLQGGAHDVYEYKNGHILASGYSMLQVIDVRNPLKPKVLASAPNDNPGYIFHSGLWPRGGKDKFLMMQGEKNAQPRCTENQGPFRTYSTAGWKKSKTFRHIDTYTVVNGTYQDGAPPANGLGCSAHWFTEHPSFNNGGLVALGYYEHGTRFLDIQSNGKIKEAGFFVPWGGSTSAAYWVNKDLVYAVDYTRGIDILRFSGK
jgi:hypothetical protein